MENDPKSGQRLLRAPFLKVQEEQGSEGDTDVENRHGGLCGKVRVALMGRRAWKNTSPCVK